jgi:dipeptidyl aminopeptidase/acylaminoacyl peptidase
MTCPFRRRAIGAVAVAALLLLPAAIRLGAARRPITETDLFRFVWIGDPQISPDGSQVVFVRVSVNQAEDRYETALWIVPSSGAAAPRQLTAGPRDTSPRWSHDGRRLAFVRAPEKDGKAQAPQVYLLDMQGGEGRPLTDLPRGASGPAWSPDGRTIAFTSQTLPGDARARASAATPHGAAAGDAGPGAHQSDVRVITKAVYRDNGLGYLDPDHRTHVWSVAVPPPDAAPAAPTQLTAGPFDESPPVWAPDGRRLYFTSTRSREPYYDEAGSALYQVAASGGEPARVAAVAGTLGQPAVSPDGRHVALVGTLRGAPVRSYSQPDLFVADAAAGPDQEARNLTAGDDADIGGGVGGDQHAPRGGGSPSPAWTPDGRAILVLATAHGRANLERVDAATGRVTAVTEGDHEVVAWSVSADGATAVVLVSTPTSIGDLFTVDLSHAPVPGAAALRPLTHVNDALFAELDLAAPEEIWYSSVDGRRINGWILKPPGFDPSKKHPLILEIHGGPHSCYGWTFTHEFSWLAAKGYVVLYTNPRGSSSYGQAFGNLIQYHYPGDDYRDLMAGVDEVVRRGYVDEKRMGVTGGSGGGVLTNWTITQTTRFAAAVSQRSIADWSAFWYTADFALFQPTWFKGAPWQDPADFTERSAITHIARVTTPLMLVEGEADYRTPPGAGGEMMFRALKYLRKPVVMVRFPNESHELSRSGQPWHRVERLQHIVGWFDKWLNGRDDGRYDVKD